MKKRFDEHDCDAAETERRMKEYQEIGLSMFNLIYGKFEFRQKKGMSRPTLIHRYLKPGSQEERKGRVALARFLLGKTPKTQEFLNQLAYWIVGRKRGRPNVRNRDQAIASFIQDCRQKSGSLKDAKEKAENHFALKAETIDGVWKHRRSLWK